MSIDEAIAAARLRELWAFCQQPVEIMVQAFVHLGVDPAKLQTVVNAMAGPEDDPIPVPRGWPKTHFGLWDALLRPAQEYLAEREKERDREIRRAQNEAANLRHEVATLKKLLEQPIGENNGKETDHLRRRLQQVGEEVTSR
jgi:hypothetical protein